MVFGKLYTHRKLSGKLHRVAEVSRAPQPYELNVWADDGSLLCVARRQKENA